MANNSESAHRAITEIMLRQTSSGALPVEHSAQRLPLRSAYVDPDSGRLVVGLDAAAVSDRDEHERTLRAQHDDVDLRYVTVYQDNCPSKKQACRPVRGGLRINSDSTMSLVVQQSAGGVNVVRTIVSSHAVGAGTGQPVGQPNTGSVYGNVIVNPPLTNRASDAALTDVTARRIQASPYHVWRAEDADYTVTGFVDSANTPEGTAVHMQGAQEDHLRSGRITRRGVTITDRRGTLTNQVYATYPAQGGDSGAPVFYEAARDGDVIYVGIHAGRVVEGDDTIAYYSPWEGIKADLGITPVF